MRWTNPSVRRLAGGEDPVAVITTKARALVADALDAGWSGPPFDPLFLADFLKLEVVPREDVPDARIVPVGRSALRIEFNPNRPRARTRYSIAHEVAHTLFPDCSQQARHRSWHEYTTADGWQIEVLCNLAASEFLAPIGSLPELKGAGLTIDKLLELRPRFELSMEALLNRVVRLADDPVAMFVASQVEGRGADSGFRIDYVVRSVAMPPLVEAGQMLRSSAVLQACGAIGHTAKGVEEWKGARLWLEVVGLPPYPGTAAPRFAGMALPQEHVNDRARAGITFLKGDALRPVGSGSRIVAQVVNDKAMTWGGSGFAAAARRRWPAAQAEFRAWATKGERHLGAVHVAATEGRTYLASLVAQKGYGPARVPRLRYGALHACLGELVGRARDLRATVHMPRIGSGQAGGSWAVVEDLVRTTLVAAGVPVTVYDLPGSNASSGGQQTSLLALARDSRA